MLATADLTYRYDGTLEGFYCCVFESYAAHELPLAIRGPFDPEQSLFAVKEIPTDPERAERVARSLPVQLGREAEELCRLTFLTCLPEKELVLLRFLRQGYHYGPRFLDFAGNAEVQAIRRAVQHLLNEAHLLKGFIRFSVQNHVLVTTIGPKNFVLPFLVRHFADRYPEEHILIYDETHGQALVYRPYEAAIIPMDEFRAAPPDAEEQQFRSLYPDDLSGADLERLLAQGGARTETARRTAQDVARTAAELERLGIAPEARPETLTPEQFQQLAGIFGRSGC